MSVIYVQYNYGATYSAVLLLLLPREINGGWKGRRREEGSSKSSSGGASACLFPAGSSQITEESLSLLVFLSPSLSFSLPPTLSLFLSFTFSLPPPSRLLSSYERKDTDQIEKGRVLL